MELHSLYLIAYTLITTSFARTLYVAPHGSDQRDDSFERPFTTLQKALDCAKQSGASISLRGGDYQQTPSSISGRRMHSERIPSPSSLWGRSRSA